jgi:hypothetical protein
MRKTPKNLKILQVFWKDCPRFFAFVLASTPYNTLIFCSHLIVITDRNIYIPPVDLISIDMNSDSRLSRTLYKIRHPKEMYSDFVDLLKRTSIEIFIVGALGTMIGTGIEYNLQARKANQLPLAFSEIGQIERDAKYQNRTLNPMNIYLPSVNDTPMKVFEAWNNSRNVFVTEEKQLKRFASELEIKMYLEEHVYTYTLSKFLEVLPERADNAKKQISNFEDSLSRLSPILNHLKKSWDRDFYESSHEDCTTTEDSDGNETETCVDVCDYYEYYFKYDKNEGNAASLKLDELILAHPTLSFNDRLRTASKTNADGEYAAEKTFLKKLKEKSKKGQQLTEADFLMAANIWYTGSTLSHNMPEISSLFGSLKSDANSLRSAKKTAKDEHRITPCIYYDGPKEYQIAKKSIWDADLLSDNLSEIITGIDYTRNAAYSLDKKIKQFIAVELDGDKGDAKKLSKEIMKTAREIYTKNFKKGLDVEPFKWYMIVLGGLCGAAAGSLVGFAWDKLGDRYLYRRKEEDDVAWHKVSHWHKLDDNYLFRRNRKRDSSY